MNYTEETLNHLLKQEKILTYGHFSSLDALQLGNTIAEFSKDYESGVCIRITRESDQAVIFQYMDDSKTARNIGFMEGKRNASLASGHSSAYVYIANQLNKEYQDMFENMPEYCPVAGAFPVRADGCLCATVTVSGLHKGKDHELIVRALEKNLQKDTGMFCWELV